MILALCHWWIVGLWIVFVIFWAIAALFVKRGVDRGAFLRRMTVRLMLFVLMAAAVVIARRSVDLHALQWGVFHSVPMAIAGAVLNTLGAVLAFSARAVIGRNWGSPMMRKTNTDLVTSGPYRFIRHPIYSGILLMMIGSAIGLTPAWWLATLAAGAYFIYSARTEERYMAECFPDAYPAYRARTKMLIPFLL